MRVILITVGVILIIAAVMLCTGRMLGPRGVPGVGKIDPPIPTSPLKESPVPADITLADVHIGTLPSNWSVESVGANGRFVYCLAHENGKTREICLDCPKSGIVVTTEEITAAISAAAFESHPLVTVADFKSAYATDKAVADACVGLQPGDPAAESGLWSGASQMRCVLGRVCNCTLCSQRALIRGRGRKSRMVYGQPVFA